MDMELILEPGKEVLHVNLQKPEELYMLEAAEAEAGIIPQVLVELVEQAARAVLAVVPEVLAQLLIRLGVLQHRPAKMFLELFTMPAELVEIQIHLVARLVLAVAVLVQLAAVLVVLVQLTQAAAVELHQPVDQASSL
jgi:hypothetical protein